MHGLAGNLEIPLFTVTMDLKMQNLNCWRQRSNISISPLLDTTFTQKRNTHSSDFPSHNAFNILIQFWKCVLI